MKGFATSPKNYSSGNRPRRFLNNTRLLINQKIMLSSAGLKYDPLWRERKAA